FHVFSGKSETISISITPFPSNQILSLAFASVEEAVRVASYFFQSFPDGETDALPIAFPLLSTSSMLSLVLPSSWAASTEKWYFCPAFTPIPRKPSFVRPYPLALKTDTRANLGFG